MTIFKFPSIEQYRNVVQHVQRRSSFEGIDENGNAIINPNKGKPSLKFRGTTKIHGTSAGIVWMNGDVLQFQSRERILSMNSDNALFMAHYVNHSQRLIEEVFKPIALKMSDINFVGIGIYGEWFGGSIQKNVAVSGLPLSYAVFAVKLITDAETKEGIWLDFGDVSDIFVTLNDIRIYSILQFPSWEIIIDFNYPETAQNKLCELTEAVERECPVGKFFGVSGCGEGIVWSCIGDKIFNDSGTWFKVKGVKHQNSKVKTLASIDPEVVKNNQDFVEKTVTEARLEQALHFIQNEMLLPLELSSMGAAIRWVYNDIIKEEQMTIVENNIDVKKIGGLVANKARPWFAKAFSSL